MSPGGQQITKSVVDLSRRNLSACAGSARAYEFDRVTGRPGRDTVPGKFRNSEKE
jgi:hypothetical protein